MYSRPSLLVFSNQKAWKSRGLRVGCSESGIWSTFYQRYSTIWGLFTVNEDLDHPRSGASRNVSPSATKSRMASWTGSNFWSRDPPYQTISQPQHHALQYHSLDLVSHCSESVGLGRNSRVFRLVASRSEWSIRMTVTTNLAIYACELSPAASAFSNVPIHEVGFVENGRRLLCRCRFCSTVPAGSKNLTTQGSTPL